MLVHRLLSLALLTAPEMHCQATTPLGDPGSGWPFWAPNLVLCVGRTPPAPYLLQLLPVESPAWPLEGMLTSSWVVPLLG